MTILSTTGDLGREAEGGLKVTYPHAHSPNSSVAQIQTRGTKQPVVNLCVIRAESVSVVDDRRAHACAIRLVIAQVSPNTTVRVT
jgi:hypothetical protein